MGSTVEGSGREAITARVLDSMVTGSVRWALIARIAARTGVRGTTTGLPEATGAEGVAGSTVASSMNSGASTFRTSPSEPGAPRGDPLRVRLITDGAGGSASIASWSSGSTSGFGSSVPSGGTPADPLPAARAAVRDLLDREGRENRRRFDASSAVLDPRDRAAKAGQGKPPTEPFHLLVNLRNRSC